MKKFTLINFGTVLLLPLFGLLLLILVHLLPTKQMLNNVYSCSSTIINEFEDELTIDGFKTTLTGNFTDCIMLENAIYDYKPFHTVLDQVLNMYRPESYYVPSDPDGMQPGNSIIDYMNGIQQPLEYPYARYWHGYLVILKPLLLFTSFNGIRLLNSLLQLFLFSLCLISIEKTFKNQHLSVAFALAVPFMFFSTTFQSLNLSICLYLTLIAILITLCIIKQKYNTGSIWFLLSWFFLLGAVTSYMDFLTYPLTVLCFPLCLCLFNENNIKNLISRLIGICGFFSIGYFYMWASKWILADIFTDQNIIKDAISTLLIRTGNANESGSRLSGYFEVLKKNLDPFSSRAYLFLFMIIIIYFICVFSVTNKLKLSVHLPIYLIIALFPFAWWFVTSNHSVQHWIFTCRIFSVSIFALLCAITSCKKEKEPLT